MLEKYSKTKQSITEKKNIENGTVKMVNGKTYVLTKINRIPVIEGYEDWTDIFAEMHKQEGSFGGPKF